MPSKNPGKLNQERWKRQDAAHENLRLARIEVLRSLIVCAIETHGDPETDAPLVDPLTEEWSSHLNAHSELWEGGATWYEIVNVLQGWRLHMKHEAGQ
ncbi:MAG: hypothetical protein M0R06_04685 [Sphaerochaeta sp.]|jgi:hypothetical protein|nr:hypothetical protein [Sphaerochaeta sp.]